MHLIYNFAIHTHHIDNPCIVENFEDLKFTIAQWESSVHYVIFALIAWKMLGLVSFLPAFNCLLNQIWRPHLFDYCALLPIFSLRGNGKLRLKQKLGRIAHKGETWKILLKITVGSQIQYFKSAPKASNYNTPFKVFWNCAKSLKSIKN